MINSLRIQADRIALEASVTDNVQELLRNTFPDLTASLKGFLGKFLPTQQALSITPAQAEFIKEISKHVYLDIAPLGAYVPEGLDVTYLEYSEVLLAASEHVATLLSGPMSSYSVFLSQLLTNADKKFDTSSFDKEHKLLSKVRDELNKRFGGCFKTGSTTTDVSVGKVVSRNSDWEHVFQNVHAINKLVNSVDRSALNKKIAECTELLDRVMAKMYRDEFVGMSGESIKNLASGAYQVARELEFFSAVYYKTLAFDESINRTIKHFHEVFKK